MSQYNVTAPDGTAYQVTAPDGASQADVLAYAQQQHVAASPPPSSGGILRNVGAGAEDAITSLPGMVVNALNPIPQAKMLYSEMTGSKYAPADQVKDMTGAGNAVSHGLNTALGPLNPENVSANSLGEKVARGVGAGLTGALIPGPGGFTVGKMVANAALGATSGAGSVAGAQLAPEPLKPLAAVAGAIAAPVAGIGALNAVGAGMSVAKDLGGAFTGAAPERTVGKILTEAAGRTPPQIQPSALPGMKPSVGQATGNPGLLYLERSAQQASPQGAALGAESRTASNTAITDAVGQLGDTSSDASGAMSSGLDTALGAAKTKTKALWKAAGIDDDTNIPKNWLQGRVDQYMGGLKVAEKDAVPQSLLETLGKIPDQNTTLGEIQAWRSAVLGKVRAAYMSGDNNTARIIGGLADVTGNFLDELPEMNSAAKQYIPVFRGNGPGTSTGNFWSTDSEFARNFTQTGDPDEVNQGFVKRGDIYNPQTPVFAGDVDAMDDAIQTAKGLGAKAIRVTEGSGQPDSLYVLKRGAVAPRVGPLSQDELNTYNAARAATKNMKQTFAQPGSPVATALSPKEFGANAESNTANLFIKPATSAGAPEAWDAYLKAIGNDPQGLQGARDAFAQKFKAAISGPPDAQGLPTINANQVSKFVGNYGHVINSDLFTPDQKNLIGNIKSAADMSARTARGGAPGGSDTFAKFSGKNWVDAMLAPGAMKAARAIGGGVGYATGGPVGAVAGAYGAPKIMETMLSANKQATTDLLTRALYDPPLAKSLMSAATKTSASKIPLPVQARIFGVLLGGTANNNATRGIQ